ncbi:MAG: ASKHA domain-containing protein [Anaerolineae bacterium]|nr:ASKHA domain-containing protein [Anaerolineae bacterium]
MTVKVEFEPLGRAGELTEPVTLLEIARALGIALLAPCGGQGKCGRCVIQITEGKFSPLTPADYRFLSPEQIAQGYRLACQAKPLSHSRIFIPPESLSVPQRLQIEGQEIPVEPEPGLRTYPLSLTPPSLQDLRPDAERLIHALKSLYGIEASLDFSLLRELPEKLRAENWRGKAAVRQSEVVAFLPSEAFPLGLAVDLGTTKIATYLVNLESGKTLAFRGLVNPQISYGEDIISRITYASQKPGGASELQKAVVEALNKAVAEMCADLKAHPSWVVEAVIVGNTAMHHLLLGLPVHQLGYAPYVPAVQGALEVKAREIGLELAPGAVVYLPPLIAGFVGSDHVAALLAAGFGRSEGPALLLDIGTNTEICLAFRGRLMSLSCASGPAFEGAHITCGMRASPGAIESLTLEDDEVKFQTIEGLPPLGLCGSGILDVVAQLRKAGVIDPTGRMGPHPRVRRTNGQLSFVISEGSPEHPTILFTQKDVREIQLAKGAIRAGIEVLLRGANLSPEDLKEVILAGAFGTYLRTESAVEIGMLPRIPAERFRQIGNAAGAGARAMLISTSMRTDAEKLARRVEYIELAAVPDFAELFARAMLL